MTKKFFAKPIIALLFALCGCAYVVVEERSAPFLVEWDGVADATLHHPGDISEVVDVEDIDVSLYLNNYSTKYRGLKILGIEVEREPDVVPIDKNEIALTLGLRLKNKGKQLIFSAHNIQLIIDQDGRKIHLLPEEVFEVQKSVVCQSDFNGFEWGANSKKIDDKVVKISSVDYKNEFYCFNVIFDVSAVQSRNYWAIDFSGTQLFSSRDKIYFHPKKIKWIRSN